MKREVYDCDRCGAKEAKVGHLKLLLDTGNSATHIENRIVQLDLCAQCAASLLGELLGKKSYEERARWYADHGWFNHRS